MNYYLFSIGLGLILGSFFNVLIWRIPRDQSILWPPSHCPNCGKKIKPWENIPVISYLLLGGKCSCCKNSISWIYPFIEILTALCSVLLCFTFVQSHLLKINWFSFPVFALQYIFLLLMLPVAVIDIRHYIIPDGFTIPLMLAGLLFSFFPGEITPLQSLTGFILGGGTLYLIGWIGSRILKKGDAMGFGDVKLMAAAGAIFGSKISLLSIVLGAFFGSVVGLSLITLKRLDADHHIPFGPFLGVGIWLAVIAGDLILETYCNFIGRLTFL
ncbi:MAG TPA: prepilin peptidase [Chitinispirillaceae bacterium]|nr:prepilin peptidase [Chitinispirillaceae bacterium]